MGSLDPSPPAVHADSMSYINPKPASKSPSMHQISPTLEAKLLSKMQASARSQSFPEGWRWNELTLGLNERRSSRPLNMPDRQMDLGGYDNREGDSTGGSIPVIIHEHTSDLVNHDLNETDEPYNHLPTAAWASITGQGLPSRADLPKSVPEPSEVTDLGNHMYKELKHSGHEPSRPADDDESDNTLADRIFDACCENIQDRADFLPKSQLDRLIHKRSVSQELSRHFSDSLSAREIDEYSHKICDDAPVPCGKAMTDMKDTSYQKIFTILVLINKVPSILGFLRENVCDGDLPLKRHIEIQGKRRKFDLRRKKDSSRRLICFKSWSQMAVRNFEQYQWAMVLPFFTKGQRKNVKHYVLESSTILPFTFTQDTDSKPMEHRGGYSLVFQADIHPDYHDFNKTQLNTSASQNTFAIKRLDSRSKDTFQQEVRVLKRFSGDAHPHLISLLATYERSDTFYLIFPWADADLMTYWKSENPNPNFDKDTVIWVAEQCRGIAEGLTKLHQYETDLKDQVDSSPSEFLSPGIIKNGGKESGRPGPLYGRHGDIKPENILWFPGPEGSGHKGTLKISDFGLSELNSRHSKSKRPGSQVANSPTYRPPECDLRKKIIKQSYDIWTLGCLYLEFIAWLLGGKDLVDKFTSQRQLEDRGGDKSGSFFILPTWGSVASGEASIKRAVTNFVTELHSHPRCTEFLHRFLLMIMNDMMIVESEEHRRMECKQVMQKLKVWHEGCISSEEFAFQSAPWST